MPTQEQAETKSFRALVDVKDADKGVVQSVFATIGVVDHDEDLLRPGSMPVGADVLMSKYGHSIVTAGELPVGDGTIAMDGAKAVFTGQLWLEMQDSRDALAVLKRRGPKQEWSFGFLVLGSEVPTDAEKKMGARRAITKMDVFEVSPVFRGAGIGTRTLAVKQKETATIVSEQADGAVADVVADPATVAETKAAIETPPEPSIADQVKAARLAVKALRSQLAEAEMEVTMLEIKQSNATEAAEFADIDDIFEDFRKEAETSEFARVQRNLKRYG